MIQKFLVTVTIHGCDFDADLYVSIGDMWKAEPSNGIMHSGFSFDSDAEVWLELPDGSLHQFSAKDSQRIFAENEDYLYREMHERFVQMAEDEYSERGYYEAA